MSGFVGEQAARLRQLLPPLDQAESVFTDPLLTAYRSHYDLDFSGVAPGLEQRFGRLHSGEFELAGQQFVLPESRARGTAILVHGYFDHSGLYGHLIRHCLRQGLNVLIFDLPGHGLSSGKAASIDSFSRYCQALEDCLSMAGNQKLARPWFAIGQSTGGAVLMDSLLHNSLQQRFNIASYVLLAPLLRPRGWAWTHWLFMITRWFLPSLRRGFGNNSHDEAFAEFLRNHDPLQSRVIPRDWVLAMVDYQIRFRLASSCPQPLTIVQGTEDSTVDWAYNLPRIEEKFPGTRSQLIAGARHHLVNESSAIRAKIFAVMDKFLIEH